MKIVRSILALSAVVAFSQTVSEIKIRPEGDDARVRPGDWVQLQIKVYSQIPKQGGAEGLDTVRLNQGGAKMRIVNMNCGVLSKPFKFQGADPEPFYTNAASRFASIISSVTKDYVLQDTFLYSAPPNEGNCEVEAELNGKSGKLTLQVTSAAPARKKQETKSFSVEQRSADPYRYLAEHWAPLVAQETWFQPKSDMIARFDYDGDWAGDNNWDNLEVGSSQAYVYYAAMETATHWFLHYNMFHPRDYSDKCIAGSCHENDNEGLILTVLKDGSEFGSLQLMETLAHNNVYSHPNDRGLGNNFNRLGAPLELYEGHHPVVFIESGGHGNYGSTGKDSRFKLADGKFTGGTGITYVYKGVAERPKGADDKLVGYELLPIQEHWWIRGTEGANWRERSFDEFYAYEPFGMNRPRPPASAGKISGAFLGRKEASNKARPFWGWYYSSAKNKKVLNQGQWALDPAYSVTQTVRFPANSTPSLDYTFNPYLGVQ